MIQCSRAKLALNSKLDRMKRSNVGTHAIAGGSNGCQSSAVEVRETCRLEALEESL